MERHASCGLQSTAGLRGTCERATALPVFREEAQHASLLLRARRVALVVINPCTMETRYTGERSLSFGAVSWCDVPAAASNAQSAVSHGAHGRATELAISQEQAQHASLMHARRVALVVVRPCYNCIWKGTEPPEGIPSS